MEGVVRGVVDDLVLIDKVDEPTIVETLQKRYEKERIYTFIGPVLISMNPYKQLNIYSKAQIENYQGRYPYELTPHVYAIAEDAYRSLVSEGQNQSIIISGESGAGKTENSKRIMEYISVVCNSGRRDKDANNNTVNGTLNKKNKGKQVMKNPSSSTSIHDVPKNERVEHVKRIFLDSNPLLEAFGNAKTVRNDNSSRFGKYMEMQFDYSGVPVGGKITNYLLEKSRVLRQNHDERNFHIFYQLLAGAAPEEKSALGIQGGPESFRYLNSNLQLAVNPTASMSGSSQPPAFIIKGVDDSAEFNHTLNAMESVGILNSEEGQSDNEQLRLLSIVASVLHLGNLALIPSKNRDAHAQVASESQKTVNCIAELLGVSTENLIKVLTTRTVTASKGENYDVPMNNEQSCYSIDAFAKGLYERLFQWIVARINQAIQLQEEGFVIGVLDIYGFEIFEVNSFEQLCINYVNEKLQQIFIDLTLKSEQEEYTREGIPWKEVEYFNNIKCVELIEAKPLGLFALLEEECVIAYGDDKNFLQKLNSKLGKNPHLVNQTEKDKVKSKALNAFTIQHYAGSVTYDATGFLDKNKDPFTRDVKSLLLGSRFPMVRGLVPEGEDKADKKRPLMAGSRFQSEVALLMKALYACQPHYIRCIKPNGKKAPLGFDQALVTDQTRYLGLLENVKVRRAGYAYRQTYEKFLQRYKMLTKDTWPRYQGDIKEGCKLILKTIEPTNKPINLDEQLQYGKTKIFIKNPEWIYALEELRLRKLHDIVKRIQATYRAYRVRKYYLELRAASMGIYQGKKERRKKSVNLKFFGDYLLVADSRPVLNLLSKFGDSKVLFSSTVKKINTSLKPQDRTLLISDHGLYNLDVKKCSFKRRLDISNFTGVSVSTLCDGFIVFHTTEPNYDYIAETDKKTEILTIVMNQYQKLKGEELPITFSDKIAFRARKGQRELLIQKGPKNAIAKKGNVLHVGVDSSELASPEEFAKVLEFARLKQSKSQPSPARALIVKKQPSIN